MEDKEKMEKIMSGISENGTDSSKMDIVLGLKDKIKYASKMFKDTSIGRYKGFSKLKFILAILAVIYAISPLDFIPDALLGLGQLDDVSIFLGAWKIIEKDIYNYKAWKDNVQSKIINEDDEIK